MYINNFKIIILLIITIIITTLLILHKSETFQTDDVVSFKYLFDTDIFDDKDVFLIANNTKLSDETLKFINNYDYTNSIVVRFNGLKPIIKDYCKGKTDVVIFRKNDNSFHGIGDYSNKFINVYTMDTKYIKNDVKNGIYNNKFPIIFKKIFDKDKNKDKNIMLTERYYDIDLDEHFYFNSGFQTLKSLYEKKKYKKIYLIGYTFHNKSINYWHNGLYEANYFHKYIKQDKNIIRLI